MTYHCNIVGKLWTSATMAIAGVGLLVLAGTGSALAVGSGAGIVNSPHDFSAATTWNFTGEICRVCHVPHDHQRAEQLYLNGLLWNHQVSTATYTMYNQAWSSTLDGAQSPQPDGIAKLCLGCHDGTVGVNQFDAQVNAAPTGFLMGDFNPGFVIPGFVDGTNLDLRGTHPLSILYDTTADPNLNVTSTTMGTSGTIADVLDAGKVQCSSCHDVHDQESVAGTHLLRVAQQTVAGAGEPSGLCLTCHIK